MGSYNFPVMNFQFVEMKFERDDLLQYGGEKEMENFFEACGGKNNPSGKGACVHRP